MILLFVIIPAHLGFAPEGGALERAGEETWKTLRPIKEIAGRVK